MMRGRHRTSSQPPSTGLDMAGLCAAREAMLSKSQLLELEQAGTRSEQPVQHRLQGVLTYLTRKEPTTAPPSCAIQ